MIEEICLMLSPSKHRAFSVLNLWKLTLVAALAAGVAGCGTKTELLKPDGKPTPRNERDPSQPPSPISR
jgi:predicted small lipoprotein YifL